MDVLVIVGCTAVTAISILGAWASVRSGAWVTTLIITAIPYVQAC